MKKRIVSLLLAAAMLVLLAVPAFAEDGHAYTYVALGDSITTGVGLKDTHFSATSKSYDVQENYHDYSKDCYVARVADALGLDRDHAVNYGMPAAMSSNILDLVRTGSTASGVAYYDLPTLRQELADADLITLLIGSNDTVLQLMGAMGRATNGKATKLLIPLLTGTMRELNLQNLQTLRKGLENLDLTPEELKAALKLLDSGMEEICDQTRGPDRGQRGTDPPGAESPEPRCPDHSGGLLQSPALPAYLRQTLPPAEPLRQGSGPAVRRRLCVHSLYLHCQRRSPHGVRSQVHRSPDPEGRPQVNVSFSKALPVRQGLFAFLRLFPAFSFKSFYFDNFFLRFSTFCQLTFPLHFLIMEAVPQP